MFDTINFSCEFEYPKINDRQLFDYDDLIYVQDHIRTFRAIHTDHIDAEAGRYYEAAVTLIDVFDMIMRVGLGIYPVLSRVSIYPNESSRVLFNCSYVTSYQNINGELVPVKKNYSFDMHYAEEGIKDGYGGYYMITITDNDNSEHYVDIGTVPLKNLVHINANSSWADRLCFPVGSEATRYCECFPTPSQIRKMAIEGWNQITKQEDLENV